MAETLARVHTHTHTQGDLINRNTTSMNNALLNIYARDGEPPLVFVCKNKLIKY